MLQVLNIEAATGALGNAIKINYDSFNCHRVGKNRWFCRNAAKKSNKPVTGSSFLVGKVITNMSTYSYRLKRETFFSL
jgi:hypothetical protein